jgi:hypothetical protein
MNSKNHAGEWYQATDGGAPLNCDDAIITLERKRLAIAKSELEKTKKESKARLQTVNQAKKIMKSKGKQYDPKAKTDQKKMKFIPNWTLADLKVMIKWKSPKRPNIPSERVGLVSVWNEVKDLDVPTSSGFSPRMESKLQGFEEGGRCTIERTFIMRPAEQRKRELYCSQISSLQPRSAMKVIGCAIQRLSEQEQRELLQGWEDCNLDDDYSDSAASSVGESESDSDSDSSEDIATEEDDDDDEANGDSSSESDEELTFERTKKTSERVANCVWGRRNYSELGDDSSTESDSNDTDKLLEELPPPRLPAVPQKCSTRQRKQQTPPQQSPPIRRSMRQRKKNN